jgi:hypothetical protein
LRPGQLYDVVLDYIDPQGTDAVGATSETSRVIWSDIDFAAKRGQRAIPAA